MILCLDEMPAGHTYLRIEMPNYKDVAGYEASAWMMFLTSMRAQQLKSAQEETGQSSPASTRWTRWIPSRTSAG